jgi:hypothetical protein
VAIAAGCGFVMGGIFTLLLPLLDRWLMALSASLSRLQPEALTIDLHIGVWVLMAGVCGITALNAYEIALIKLTPKRDAPSRA